MTTPFIVLSMRFVNWDHTNGEWTLFDAEENDVGTVSSWVAESLGGRDYTGETEYAVTIEPVEP